MELDWKAPSRDGGSKVKAYHIYQSTTPGDWQEVATVKSFDNHFSVSGLKEGVAYNFAIAAENEAGVGKMCETDKPVKPVKSKGKLLNQIVMHGLISKLFHHSHFVAVFTQPFDNFQICFRKTIYARKTIHCQRYPEDRDNLDLETQPIRWRLSNYRLPSGEEGELEILLGGGGHDASQCL